MKGMKKKNGNEIRDLFLKSVPTKDLLHLGDISVGGAKREGKLILFKFQHHHLEKPTVVYRGSGFRFYLLAADQSLLLNTMTSTFQ